MKYEEFYESFGDGDLGSCNGFNVDGHLDFQEVEEFMATAASEWFDQDDAPARGFDVRHQWVRKVPRHWGHTFQYQDHPGRGAKAVTRIEVETTWDKRCYRHPFEVAQSGLHESRFIDGAGKGDSSGYIYYCRPCMDRINAELAEATKKAMAEYEAEKKAKEAAAAQ